MKNKHNSLVLMNEWFSKKKPTCTWGVLHVRTCTHTWTEVCLSKQKMRTFPQFSPRPRPAGQWDSQVSWRCRNLLEHIEVIQTPLPHLPPLFPNFFHPPPAHSFVRVTGRVHLCLDAPVHRLKPVVKINRWLAIKWAHWPCFSFSLCHCRGKLLSEPDSSLGCRSRVVYLNN